MAKNDMSVSNNFYKAGAKKSLYERIYQAEETKSLEELREKKNNAKRQNRSEYWSSKGIGKEKQSRTYQRPKQKSIKPFKECYAELKAKPNWNLSRSRLY